MAVDIAEKTDRKTRRGSSCDQAAPPARAVVLHLRERYVSKAAILTIPAPLAPAENRSPA
jgi:hypothetical protein